MTLWASLPRSNARFQLFPSKLTKSRKTKETILQEELNSGNV